MQYGEVYLEARKALLETEDAQTAGLIARNLLSHVSGMTQEGILSSRDMEAPASVCRAMRDCVHRIIAGEPLAYILGEWEFYGLPMYVDENVLIPRDDTCAVTSLAINQGIFLEQDPRILDMCCGTGCIGLAVASRVPDARVTLADISKDALAVAKKNIQRNKLGGRVSCIQADVRLAPPAFMGKFDLIVCNPPYITSEEMLQLPVSVKEYEPHLALFGGDDGLDFYRAIAANYTAALKPGGYLCLEFGMGQGDDVCRILEEYDYAVLERTKDYNDRERAVLAQLRRKEF